MTYRPMPGKVFVQPTPLATHSTGGLAIVTDHWTPEVSGTVIAVGECANQDGLAPGDFVVFSPLVGQEISIGSDRWLIVPIDQILAVEERT